MSEEDKVADFQSLTGVPATVARNLLEATSWDIQAAAEVFFAGPETEAAAPPASGGPMQFGGGGGRRDEDDEDEEWTPQVTRPSHAPQPPAPQQQGTPTRMPPAGRGFASLSDLRDNAPDDEGKQNMFAGGEKSGLSIQNPGEPSSAQDEIRNLIRAAMANALPPGAPGAPQAPPTGQPTTFHGTGYTLGSDSQPSLPVPQNTAAGPGTVTERHLRLWRNGFTIEGVPRLFAYDVPENIQMLREMRMGRVPRMIAGVNLGADVNMRVEKREQEDYEPPKASHGGFHGHGVRLGSAIPGFEAPAAPQPVTITAPASTTADAPKPPVDPSQPQTTLQIRLADGTRLVTQFNLSATMDDVYAFVGGARLAAGREFVLQTIFPTKVLERGGTTVEEERLQGGTVVMRWKA